MQKKLIALAVAGLASTAAFAQSNVTVYGVADLGQAYVKTSGANTGNMSQPSVGRLDNNSSYIGFKGTEDLGNGLKAMFQYESNIAADVSGGVVGGRDTFVGLAGGFGTVVAGTLTHPLRAFGAKVELAPGAAGFGTMASVTGSILGTKTGADDRATNAVAYVSPSFSGFTATVAYVNGENRTNSTPAVASVSQKSYQFAGQYDNGPLFAALGYHRAVDTGVTSVAGVSPTVGAAGGKDTTITRAAAVYNLPSNTKLTALYDRTVSETSIAGVDKASRNAWSVGVAQTFGANTVGLEYGRAEDAKVGGKKQNDTSANITSVIYTYALSKRTMVHARYSRLSNDKGIATAFYNNPVANSVALTQGADSSGYMVGLRHSF